MMKQVMKRAWELAKQGVKKFGGKVREYLAASLSLAWKEVKNMGDKLAELVGSAKQVKWAEDIRKKAIEELEEALKTVTKNDYFRKNGAKMKGKEVVEIFYKDCKLFEDQDVLEEVRSDAKQALEYLKNETSAKFFIENREKLDIAIGDKLDIAYAELIFIMNLFKRQEYVYEK